MDWSNIQDDLETARSYIKGGSAVDRLVFTKGLVYLGWRLDHKVSVDGTCEYCGAGKADQAFHCPGGYTRAVMDRVVNNELFDFIGGEWIETHGDVLIREAARAKWRNEHG